MSRRDPDWRGIAAAVLALGVVAVLIVGEVLAWLNVDKIISAEEIATISTVLGAAIGAIATYLGTRRGPPDDPGPGGSSRT